MDKVMVAIQDCEAWLEVCRQKFHQNFQLYKPVPIKSKEILEQRRTLENKIFPIINSPKPKVEPPPQDEQKKKDDTESPKKPTESPKANHNEPSGDSQPANMEVD